MSSRAATAVSVLALAAACTSSGNAGDDSESRTPEASPAVSSEPSDPTATETTTPELPRPMPATIRTVRKEMIAQRFRRCSGPRPPSFSETEALQRGRFDDDYSLGLWTVGMVHSGPFVVTWRPVWIIAAERYYEDLSQLSLGGPVQPDAPPEPSGPGWVRYITMLDARTGRFVLEYSF
jgi:hypothetical protein